MTRQPGPHRITFGGGQRDVGAILRNHNPHNELLTQLRFIICSLSLLVETAFSRSSPRPLWH